MAATNNIPALRFPEFSGEWERETLSHLTKVFDGTHMTPDYQVTGVPFYSVEHVTANQFDNTKYISEEVYERENRRVKLERGDILMTRIGDIGTPRIIDWDVKASFYVSLALIKGSDSFNSSYVNQFIFTRFFQSELWQRTIHVAFPKKINLGEIGACHINLPTLPEQEKIASFLTAVDSKVQQLTKKVELLQQYKKGAMQQLFSQQIRFKKDDGTPYPDWEEKRLGEVGKIVNGLTYSPKDIVKDGLLVLRSSNIQNRVLCFDDNVYVKVDQYNAVVENDILICVRNGSKRLIGKNALISKKYEGLAFGAFMTVFRSKFNKYLTHIFDTDIYNKEIYRNLGATINSINGSELKAFKVPFPCFEEQQKIASFLNAIDDKINQVQTQLQQAQQFKKGLLQQMFV